MYFMGNKHHNKGYIYFFPLTFDICFLDIECSPVTAQLLSHLSLSLKDGLFIEAPDKNQYSLQHLTTLCVIFANVLEVAN